MTRDQAVLLALCVLGVLCLVLVVALLRVRAVASRVASDLEALRQQLDGLEHRAAERGSTPTSTVAAPVEFVITDLGRPDTPAEPPAEAVRLDGPAFADIVLKETVVKAASFAHGVRRGLAPATRNRIRFEMKQEVRRARRQRRADLKAARRDLHARQRAALAAETREAS
jgi:hypothetical protein